MEEDVKELLHLKADLEMQLHDKKEEIKLLERRLKALNSILAKLSVNSEQAESENYTYRTVVRDKWGTPIAHIDVNSQLICLIPAKHARIMVNSKPFRIFLFNRVLGPMQQEDERAIVEGVLSPGDGITFECLENQGSLVKLLIKNYRTEERLVRIREALAWVVKRAHRKTSSTT